MAKLKTKLPMYEGLRFIVMAIRFYMDVHVPMSITEQLRRRGVDVLTAIEDESATLKDDELIQVTIILFKKHFFCSSRQGAR